MGGKYLEQVLRKELGGKYLEQVLRKEGKFWYKVPCCCFLVDGYCYFLVASGWLMIFPFGLWMVADISWWPLDGGCYCLMASGWLLLFPGTLWMVADIS